MPPTIEQFILSQQESCPEASGTMTRILCDISVAAKVIASYARRAGLGRALGTAGGTNVHGEAQMRLDVLADQAMQDVMLGTGRLALMGSEEHEDPILADPDGKYVLLYDPLDGSSNIDVNVSVGTIFSIMQRSTPVGMPGALSDCLQAGRAIVAAGYVIYGPSTMLVYSTGKGVHGFTLDASVGEFFLTHESMRIPDRPKYYSANYAYEELWDGYVRDYVGQIRRTEGISLRWVGSLVADFHRNLLAGGTFCYPGDSARPAGRLRLLYEAAPLSFVAGQAGGYASDGERSIMDVEPTGLHQRTPLFIGDKGLTSAIEEARSLA